MDSTKPTLKYLIIIALLSSPISTYANEEDEKLFKGINQKINDYSCGTAAFSTLIKGIVENSHITEQDVINNIGIFKLDKGYSAADLIRASTKLGYKAELRTIPQTELPKIKLPVVLLIGLNSEFPHYVVLKGVRNNEAYLADPIRGNIRVYYDVLTKEGINNKYPEWFVMAINPSTNKPKDSNLYLSDVESERRTNHITVEQSNAITLATLSKENQFIIDYDFVSALSHNKQEDIITNSQNFSHRLNIRYGITNEFEIGGSFQYLDNNSQIKFEDIKVKENSDNRAYSFYVNNRFKLDDSGKNNVILGLTSSYAENHDIFGGSFNLTAYSNTEFAQVIAGGSIGKELTHNTEINSALSQYNYSGFIGANKPIADRYLGFLNFSVNNAQAKNNSVKFKHVYSVSTGLTYVLSKHYQISPSFSYLFGQSDVFVFGMNIAYVGGW